MELPTFDLARERAAAWRGLVLTLLFVVLGSVLLTRLSHAQAVPAGTPDAVLDLATTDGARAANATWRAHDVALHEVDFRAVGPDRRPSGPPNRTWDIAPHAGAADYDDREWPVIEPASLADRRADGRLCFEWYRLAIEVPSRVGAFDPTGSTIVLDVTVDDYAEIWVNGALTRTLGQRGGTVVAGWNAPNRVVLARDAKPGQRLTVAIFGINGPISDTPANYVWIRAAKLEFHRPLAEGLAFAPRSLEVERRDRALDALVPADVRLETLADGFQFGEGPVWSGDQSLLFSDPNTNVIYRWSPAGRVNVIREHSGYDGADVGRLHQPGSNGLAFDREGRLTICEHGNRRVTRLERDGSLTVIADRFDGRRLNSPNDLVYRSDGTLYFTDPPFGLPKAHDDPARELEFSGVYCWRDGELRVVTKDFSGPNGLAFSPDEKFLYVTNWDTKAKHVRRYDVRPDGSLANGRLFFDMTGAPGEEALDGIKVDERGNLYCSGPGGVWVISPAGKHIGTIRTPLLPANLAWGDGDGRTLYLTARSTLYRLRLNVAGAGASAASRMAATREPSKAAAH